jgi:hypothetical protein
MTIVPINMNNKHDRIEFPAFLVLPVIYQNKDIKAIFHTDWYDGPIDGLLSYMDEKYWFTLIYEKHVESTKRIRWFVLCAPTQEQLDMHVLWHEKFERANTTSALDEFYRAYEDIKFPPFDYSQAKYLMIE